jgi:hypothetical protein
VLRVIRNKSRTSLIRKFEVSPEGQYFGCLKTFSDTILGDRVRSILLACTFVLSLSLRSFGQTVCYPDVWTSSRIRAKSPHMLIRFRITPHTGKQSASVVFDYDVRYIATSRKNGLQSIYYSRDNHFVEAYASGTRWYSRAVIATIPSDSDVTEIASIEINFSKGVQCTYVKAIGGPNSSR